MSAGAAWAGGNCTGTKVVGTALFAAPTNAVNSVCACGFVLFYRYYLQFKP